MDTLTVKCFCAVRRCVRDVGLAVIGGSERVNVRLQCLQHSQAFGSGFGRRGDSCSNTAQVLIIFLVGKHQLHEGAWVGVVGVLGDLLLLLQKLTADILKDAQKRI